MTINPSFGGGAPNKADFDKYREENKKKRGDRPPQPLEAAGPIELDAPISRCWPPRDQYGRGTCVAFGAIAAIELFRSIRDDMPPERLSEQFLHERMLSTHTLSQKELDALPEGGVLLRQAWQVIEEDGLIGAHAAPYKPTILGLNETGPTPSQEVLDTAKADRFTCHSYGRVGVVEGLDHNRVDFFQPGDRTAEKLLAFLQKGMPVAVGVPLFLHSSGLTNWTLPSALNSGVVYCPEDANAPALEGPRKDGHVICLTGFLPSDDEPMGGWFTFRNSWGLEFAAAVSSMNDSRNSGKRGNGLISATHLNEYCWEYLVPHASCAEAQAA